MSSAGRSRSGRVNAPDPPRTPPAVLAVATAAAAVLLTALFALFRVDRMTDWPWWLVMSPLWIWGGILTAVTVVVVVRGIAAMIAAEREQ